MTDALLALRPWEEPEITSWRRLPMNAVDRRSGALPLDGDWRFQLLPAPDAPVGGAWSSSYVPGAWTMQDTDDRPQYTNVRMPYTEYPPQSPAANPTGLYEREVDVPVAWAGQRVVLQVGAAESVLLVHVDGRPVGVSKDSHLAAEFDLSRVVRPGQRATVRLTVVKWSDASHIEDQDQWWHGGITRSVLLYATDPLHLADVTVRARAAGEVRVDCRVRDTGGALPAGWYVSGELDGRPLVQDEEFDRAGAEDERVSDFLGEARILATVPDVRPWTAETPELYDLTVRLHRPDGAVADTSRHRVGFRDVEIAGRDLLINGERVYIRGVNRHDFHPLTGRTVSCDDMRADLVLLKRFGFNAIRTSHYPNDPALYDLADELGFYVVDEADIEAHDHAHEIADDPRYLNAFVDRVSRMVLRDKNHPSVIVWSLGNESDYGANHDAAAGWVRRHDPTRPVQYEGAAKLDWAATDDASDIACPMYAPIEDCVAHALSGRQTRPLIQCEYSHAMGNSNGTLADHWAAIESTPGLQGGFIWEFWDHGILQRVSDGRPAGRAGAGLYADGVAAPGHRWAYGGDFGEAVHDGAFVADGVVFPDRTPKPALYEHREIAAPVRIECLRHEGIVLGNHQHFRGLDWLAGEWELSLADGRTLTAPAELPDLSPGETAAVPLPFALPRDGGEAWLTLRVTTAGDEPWAPRGTEICVPQVRLRGPAAREVVAVDRRVEVDGDGLLVHPLLASAPTLSLWRAPTDNDELGGIAPRWRAWGLDALVRKPVSVRCDGARVTAVAEYAGRVGVVRHVQVFTPVEGGLRVEESAELPEEFDDVARVGSVFETVAGLDLLEWFGQGPWESYPDRSTGAPVGHHRLAVDELFTPYLRPQESGGRHGVRRFTLSASGATGLAVELDEPRQVSVTRHRDADLTAAAHHDELVPRAGCVVHIDAAHRGVGTASCGPDTSPAYRIPPGVHRWSWTLSVL
ncbi:glycoside hydrolase family 2 TIM barrel-domain containing protein [Streptomyces sp. Li-HN-5-11]|uniref:glycoside hydrolase family 2 TIM barrel-domain containing protein n=1 Tax=Streptomyces sp. Li-HN-5-11 TaxID=3075432 RepID=UPI0028AE603D|nr:glycoside hydrolase family 2 TIM barrel-domain containing protein [Streptomyces sp. Li-HN-5-11]WNM31518.1 glycoside hydrolase family 2 TIM barrel-domain containing protein [Streptomyces sp. Li-HN-5-11]